MTDMSRDAAARICVCVTMTQPFADQIPLIREIYRDRFSHLVFLIPFERVDDPDVITVYRGPYARAGYLTDAREALARIDCDFFLVVDHELLLNPRFDERSLMAEIPLGLGDGFYPSLMPLPASIGGWSRYFGVVPKMVFPKSLLFGSGIEREVLGAYLPDRHEAVHGMQRTGAPIALAARLETRAFGDIVAAPSRVLLHGMNAPLPAGSPGQRETDRLSLGIERGLVEAMAAALRAEAGEEPTSAPKEQSAQLAVPMTAGSVPPSLYILPRSRLEAFAHYAGVASAANLDAELVVPTLLYILCDSVRTPADYRFSVRGLSRDPDISALADPRVIAVHPVQLARFARPSARRRLLGELARLAGRRRRRAVAAPGMFPLGLDGTLQGFAHRGWHPRESWGRWMSQPRAALRFWVPRDAEFRAVRISLLVPVHAALGEFKAFVTLNGGERLTVRKAYPDAPEAELFFDQDELRRGAMNWVTIECERVVRPVEFAPQTGDRRRLGLGVSSLEFVARGGGDYAAPEGPLPAVGPERDMLLRRGALLMEGFHAAEDWGRWASQRHAVIRFRVARDVTAQGLRVYLGAPISARSSRPFAGSVRLNGGEVVRVFKQPGDPDAAEVLFPVAQIEFDGENLLELISDVMVRPIDDMPETGDERKLGWAFHNVGLVTPVLDALRLPTAGTASGHERLRDAMLSERHGHPAAATGYHAVAGPGRNSFLVAGWHGPEDWGRWAAFVRATLQFWAIGGQPLRTIRLVLRPPPKRKSWKPATGRLRLNGGSWVPFTSGEEPDEHFGVDLPAGDLIAPNATNWIELVTDRMVYASEIDPSTPDPRRMGFGVVGIQFD